MEEIKSRLQSGNACCHLVQNVLCCGLVYKNINIKINRTVNCACCVVWVWNLVNDNEGGTWVKGV